jgi:tRNA (guanine-N1)-methyltransferase
VLDHPHYTRPPVWRGRSVPEVLKSGDHAAIQGWREAQASQRTRARRPDLVPTLNPTEAP